MFKISKFIVFFIAVLLMHVSELKADNDVKPLNILKAEELLSGNASHYFKDFNKAVDGQCEQLMSRLKSDVKDENPDMRYSAHVVLAELHDRALCVPFDPAQAFEHFKTAADMGGPYYNLFVAWKYINSHGVEKSIEKANNNYKIFFQRIADSQLEISVGELFNDKVGRQTPDEFFTGLEWFNKIRHDDERLLQFALSMIDGTGVYHDGTEMPVDVLAARYTLDRLALTSTKAIYHVAMEEKKGTFGKDRIDNWHTRLGLSARCGYIPAMIKLSEVANDKNSEHYDTMDAYGWLWHAKKNGADVNPSKLEELKNNASSVADLLVPDSPIYKLYESCAQS